jgi:hypothetical protein
MRSRLPMLVKEELRKRADPPKFVEKLTSCYLSRRRLHNGLKNFELHRQSVDFHLLFLLIVVFLLLHGRRLRLFLYILL